MSYIFYSKNTCQPWVSSFVELCKVSTVDFNELESRAEVSWGVYKRTPVPVSFVTFITCLPIPKVISTSPGTRAFGCETNCSSAMSESCELFPFLFLCDYLAVIHSSRRSCCLSCLQVVYYGRPDHLALLVPSIFYALSCRRALSGPVGDQFRSYLVLRLFSKPN